MVQIELLALQQYDMCCALTVTDEGTVASQTFWIMPRMTYIFTFNKFNNSSSFLHSKSWTQ